MNRHPRKTGTLAPILSLLCALVFGLVASSYATEEKSAPAADAHSAVAPPENPELLSFDELVTLSGTAKPEGTLAARLDSLLNTPFVQSEKTAADIAPRRPDVRGLGTVLRVGLWNIERGLNFELIRAALGDRDEFLRLATAQPGLGLQQKAMVESQLAALHDVDVLILNEADWGMKRTEYRDVTRELAAALHMNYAYGAEFVEVDPIFDLGSEQVHLPDAQEDQRLQEDLRVDKDRYHGLHGTAILSRYPLENARIFRLPVCYDWYANEYKAISKLEVGRRWSAQKLFRERVERELRHGGRMALIADISVPDLPTGRATVVAAHLENKCPPACRKRQMQALLADLKEDRNPVLLAGDFNTTSSDNTPTSIRNEIMSRITDYKFWIGQAVSYFHPLGIFKYALFPVRYFHGYNDPSAFHLPILWDNRERPLFGTMEKFRFTDNHAFDFRGEQDRTAPPRSRTLADSNQRTWKGFVPTYAFNRDFGGLVGRFKLDWILVKPFIDDPRRAGQSYRLAPSFPVTMRELNEAVVDRVSDHAPMTVDLPLTEPAKSAGQGQP
ncbi:MAG: endonuclease/exonuclease/phosphatase family protein [Candidatus Acidiferrum sp.]|jgi:endonuclease/exonuclease/phosphatase family metal-dependent hydrolase